MPLLRPLRPVRREFRLTRAWGVKQSDYTLGYHTGDDFGCPPGTRVRAPRTGRITKVAFSPEDYGWHVEMVDHKGVKGFLVAHLTRATVKEGQRVVRGQTIGRSGASGWVSAAHVHAEQRHAPFGFRDNEKPGWRA